MYPINTILLQGNWRAQTKWALGIHQLGIPPDGMEVVLRGLTDQVEMADEVGELIKQVRAVGSKGGRWWWW